MISKKDFIYALENIVDFNNTPEEVQEYWRMFKEEPRKDKPLFTDNGKKILTFLREHMEKEVWKSSEIAEGMFVSTKLVSGSIRKLVTDGYVEKVSIDPIIYSLTDLGKNIEIV